MQEHSPEYARDNYIQTTETFETNTPPIKEVVELPVCPPAPGSSTISTEPDVPITRTVDWKQWINTIQCMDCIEAITHIPDNSIDCIISDPPYGINYFSHCYGKKGNPFKPIANDDTLFIPIDELWRILKSNGSMFLFYSQKVPLIDSRVKNVIVWVKNSGTMGDLEGDFQNCYELCAFIPKGNFKLKTKRYSNVWHFDKVPPTDLLHPTQKPEALIRRIVDCATNEGNLVLDAFMGSGTTAIACKQMRRSFIGFDLEQSYCDVANKRLAQLGIELKNMSWKESTIFKPAQHKLTL